MIIKRRVTRQFVQLSNETVRDTRFSLEAHGLLDYLLSLPDDWEINLKHIEKTWNIGRDKRRRIFNELRRYGWAQLERMTSEDGSTFLGQRWIIGDDPGPENPDAGTVDDDDTEDADDASQTMNATAAPERQSPDALASGDRETPFQSVGLPDGRIARPPENPSLPRRKTPEEERDSTNTTEADAKSDSDDDDCVPPPRFGELLKMWPADNIASAYACERVFVKFTDKQKREAHKGIKPYLQDCREKGHNRLCDLRTYLDERRFEKFAGKEAGRQLYVIKRGTPECERFREHFKKHEPHKLAAFEIAIAGNGYTATTPWPPAMPGVTPAAAPTVQRSPLMTDEDEQVLARG